MNAVPKLNPVRDRKYPDSLRDQPCILTGWTATEEFAVDPMHIGTLGKGIKSSDDEALPVRHEYHVRGHNEGEISMFRKHAPDWLLREALREYARRLYREYRASTPTPDGSTGAAEDVSPSVNRRTSASSGDQR